MVFANVHVALQTVTNPYSLDDLRLSQLEEELKQLSSTPIPQQHSLKHRGSGDSAYSGGIFSRLEAQFQANRQATIAATKSTIMAG